MSLKLEQKGKGFCVPCAKIISYSHWGFVMIPLHTCIVHFLSHVECSCSCPGKQHGILWLLKRGMKGRRGGGGWNCKEDRPTEEERWKPEISQT